MIPDSFRLQLLNAEERLTGQVQQVFRQLRYQRPSSGGEAQSSPPLSNWWLEAARETAVRYTEIVVRLEALEQAHKTHSHGPNPLRPEEGWGAVLHPPRLKATPSSGGAPPAGRQRRGWHLHCANDKVMADRLRELEKWRGELQAWADKTLEARPPSSSGEGYWPPVSGPWLRQCPCCRVNLLVTVLPPPGGITVSSRSMPFTAGGQEPETPLSAPDDLPIRAPTSE